MFIVTQSTQFVLSHVLYVSPEHPVAVLSQEKMEVEPGQTLSVSCNVSGHPMPALQWVRKTNNNHLVTVVRQTIHSHSGINHKKYWGRIRQRILLLYFSPLSSCLVVFVWTQDAGRGRVRMEDGYVLVIDNVTPSDGGLYSCMAISPAGNASTDFSLQSKATLDLPILL